MRILIVCNRNVMRSIFSIHYLRSVFADIDFQSAGRNTSEEFVPNWQLAKLLEEMKIPFSYTYSRSLQNIDFRYFTYIIAFDRQNLPMHLRYMYRDKIIFIEDYIKNRCMRILDPLNFDLNELEQELVKIAHILIEILHGTLGLKKGNPVLLIPLNKCLNISNRRALLDIFVKSRAKVIDMSFGSVHEQVKLDEHLGINFQEVPCDIGVLDSLDSSAWRLTNPDTILPGYLSSRNLNTIQDIRITRPVTIITPSSRVGRSSIDSSGVFI